MIREDFISLTNFSIESVNQLVELFYLMLPTYLANMAPPSPGLAIGPAYVKTNNDYWLLTRMPLDELSADLKVSLSSRVLRLNPEMPIGYARDLNILPNKNHRIQYPLDGKK